VPSIISQEIKVLRMGGGLAFFYFCDRFTITDDEAQIGKCENNMLDIHTSDKIFPYKLTNFLNQC